MAFSGANLLIKISFLGKHIITLYEVFKKEPVIL